MISYENYLPGERGVYLPRCAVKQLTENAA